MKPGSQLGPYEIRAVLGKGGMGEVYRAFDPRLEREIAIKILPEDVGADAERLARFKLPTAVERISEVPRNASGKILKVDLRKPYWEEASQTTSRGAS